MAGRRFRWRVARAAVAAALLAIGAAGSAGADFPYLPRSGGDPHNPLTWKLPAGETPSNLNNDWRFFATPETSPQSNALVNPKPQELCGVEGASIADPNAVFPLSTSCVPPGTPVRTAFEQTLGRPDVIIAVLDSGIEWNNPGAMIALRNKVHLNQGELPAPRHDLNASLVSGENCASYRNATGGDYNRRGNYDVNGDGVFDVRDYACDSRVAGVVSGGSARHAMRHGPAGVLTPEDLILAFSDGRDHDHNGYANDIAGWNFVDDTNDPFDDVQYGHGTGEAKDSNGEANTAQELGTCPDCTVLPLRVGQSFIADDNRFAQAVLYATDANAYVIQEALGTLNNSYFARQAVEYAYQHGTAVIGSAADEAAEHHNQPGELPDIIVVNSVTKYTSFTAAPPSYLQFNGCTNFGTRVELSVPSTSCSSEATGKSAGVAGLIYSAALNGIASGRLHAASDCTRVDGSPCPITANEVRQLMASGNIAGTTTPGQGASAGNTPADAGAGGQADDVNFALQPETSCSPAPVPTCTDPNLNTVFSPAVNGGVDGPAPATRRYHARAGYDQFYGYGRLNADKAVSAAANGTFPPEAELTSPDWYQQLDPASPYVTVGGYVNARGGSGYTCSLQFAPGDQPNNGLTSDTPPGDFAPAPSTWCDGHTVHHGAYRGTVGQISTAALKARFPATDGAFNGNENAGTPQTSNGRPNTAPYAFTIRLVVSTPASGPSPAMTGEDRRQMWLHRDQQMLAGFPRELRTDGASSPLLIDLAGNNYDQLILATSDGQIHAFRRNGGELPGWPVHTNQLPLHTGAAAYRNVGSGHYCAVLGALAGGDLFHDGRIEIVADDNCGNVYAWDSTGRLVFRQQANPAFSGAPLAPFATVRNGPRDRTEHGFLASPVLAHLSGKANSPLDIIVAGDDRHVYAWQPKRGRLAGSTVSGFPVLVADPDKLTAVDPRTNHLTFDTSRASANPGIDEDQGKLVDTPAVATVDGKPEIIVGSNEEYAVNTGDEGPINAGDFTSASVGALGATGALQFGNGRLYVIKPTGGSMTCGAGGCHSTAFERGWPKKIGLIDRGLLPDVGEGIDGSPVVAPLTCPQGGHGIKIGVTPDAGPSYLFNPNGTSCYGTDQSGRDNSLETDFSQGHGQYDHPAFSAVGYPAFGTLDGHTIDYFAPEAGLIRTLDVALPDYQGGQDFIAAWNPGTGQQSPGFPATMNDLQFLTGPAIGQITASGGQDVVEGSSSLDLQAYDAAGLPAGPAWPKLTGDWTVATPTLGSFGTFDTSPAAHKVLVSITRSGTLAVYNTAAPVCSPSSSPRFHHDNWSSGDYAVDAIDPGKPYNVARGGSKITFNAPGGDLLCGRAAGYQLVTSNRPITPENFASAKHLNGAPKPAAAGARQSLTIPTAAERYVALRAVDQAGNLGLPVVVDTGRTGTGTGSGSSSGGSPGPNRPPFTGAADRPRRKRP